MDNQNFLVVLVGPTAIGKTELSIKLAKYLDCEIISADSRQFYQEISIGTAKPDKEEMEGIKHHFIDFLPVEEEMSAGSFETLVIHKLNEIFKNKNTAIIIGGSGLYIKAVCEGMSDMPTPPKEYREELMHELNVHGIERLQSELKQKDPAYYQKVDINNSQRVVRALEMIRYTGNPFSSYHIGNKAERPFKIIKIGLEMDREKLYDRINKRVDQMLEKGLVDEVRKMRPKKDLNALQTVGYKEIFDYLDGVHDFDEAVRLIKRNTRRYAKRQMTWFKREEEITWFHPDQLEEIKTHIELKLNE